MSLLDFLFPQTAAAVHLRNISGHMRERQLQSDETKRLDDLKESTTVDALKARIDELEGDLGFVVLVLASLLSALDEKGSISRDDIEKELRELDIIDGRADSMISIRILKQYLKDQDAH